MPNHNVLIANALAVISDELDELRDTVRNANKPVIEALGAILLELKNAREDSAAHILDVNRRIADLNDQTKNLRKAAALVSITTQ